MRSKVFRQVSLDRLASPEQLDQVMRVTTARGWVALAAIGFMLATGVVWSVAGSLSDKVQGRGILVKTGGVLEVVANAGGRITDVAVGAGESVTEGQVVARVAQPELFEELQQAKAELRVLREEHEQRTAYASRDAALQRGSLRQQAISLRESIAAGEENLRWLGERIGAQERLVEQGLVTRTALLATRQQHDQAEERIHASRGELTRLDIQLLALENSRAEATRDGAQQIARAEARVALVQRDFDAASQVVSPYTGRILEVLAEQGNIVARGEPVLSLDLTGRTIQDLVAVIYVPSIDGKKIKPGMRIRVAPSTVRQEEHGMMLGEVTFVSSFPSTPRGMGRVLKNEGLVAELSGGGAPYEIHAELVVDPATASGYRWSSSNGPPMPIQSGTLALAEITVAAQKPIAAVIPLLRRWSGI